jgi:hypothetical protein
MAVTIRGAAAAIGPAHLDESPRHIVGTSLMCWVAYSRVVCTLCQA